MVAHRLVTDSFDVENPKRLQFLQPPCLNSTEREIDSRIPPQSICFFVVASASTSERRLFCLRRLAATVEGRQRERDRECNIYIEPAVRLPQRLCMREQHTTAFFSCSPPPPTKRNCAVSRALRSSTTSADRFASTSSSTNTSS